MATSIEIWKESQLHPNGRIVTAVLDEKSLLPLELVEDIIARLPLKCIFQSLTLSREWSRKIRSIGFQREALRVSSGWECYSSVLYKWDKMEMMGYGSVSKRWHRLPTNPPSDSSLHWNLGCSCGSLLVWTTRSRCNYRIYVSNPLTLSGRELPAPSCEARFVMGVYAISQGRKSYKVIIISVSYIEYPVYDQTVCHAHVFDSASNFWTESRYTTSFFWSWGFTVVNCDGTIYMLGVEETKFQVSYNVEKDCWTQYQVSFEDSPEYNDYVLEGSCCLAVVNKSDVMLVSFHVEERNSTRIGSGIYLKVHRVDLESGLLVLVSNSSKSSPQLIFSETEALRIRSTDARVIGQGDCIYIGFIDMCLRSLVYNVSTDKWTELSLGNNLGYAVSEPGWSWVSSNYEPGLNPFLEVSFCRSNRQNQDSVL